MHESLDEFEFRQDPATDYGVSSPFASEKSMYNTVNTLALYFRSNFLHFAGNENNHKVWTEF